MEKSTWKYSIFMISLKVAGSESGYVWNIRIQIQKSQKYTDPAVSGSTKLTTPHTTYLKPPNERINRPSFLVVERWMYSKLGISGFNRIGIVLPRLSQILWENRNVGLNRGSKQGKLFVLVANLAILVAIKWAPKKEGFVVISRVEFYFQNADQNSF